MTIVAIVGWVLAALFAFAWLWTRAAFRRTHGAVDLSQFKTVEELKRAIAHYEAQQIDSGRSN